jgi:hypothetical protein
VKGHPFHKTGENLLFVWRRHQPYPAMPMR